MEAIPKWSPNFSPPIHLIRFVSKLEGAFSRPLRLVTHTPPRHGKTETLLHWIAWCLVRNPRLQAAYVSYAASIARNKALKCRNISMRAGVTFDPDSRRVDDWRTAYGGGLLATGVGGPLTGHGVELMVVDDPIKNRAEAESAVYREKSWDWFTDVALTRLEPGASVIVNMARWHRDDLAGRLIERGWEYIRIPALSEEGKPLWPERHPFDKLMEIQRTCGPYTWASLYQGEPTPRGGAVFRGCLFGSPPKSFRISVGLDFNYSTKSHADYSVAVVMMEGEGRYHVPSVIRAQTEAPVFARDLVALNMKYPGASWYAYVSGPEKGVVDFINTNYGLRIQVLPINGDKLVRAQPAAGAWNDGKITVPEGAEWVGPFASEVCDFTGVKDAHDDQVDALAAAYDGLTRPMEWWRELSAFQVGKEGETM